MKNISVNKSAFLYLEDNTSGPINRGCIIELLKVRW